MSVAVFAIEICGDEGEREHQDGDADAGERKLAVGETGGEHQAADGGSDGVAEVEGSLIERGGEVGGFVGVLDDAGLEGCSGGELDRSPDEDHGDGGDGVWLGEVEEEFGGDEGEERAEEEGQRTPVAQLAAEEIADGDANSEEEEREGDDVGSDPRYGEEHGGDVGVDAEEGGRGEGAHGEDEQDLGAA